MKIQKASEQNFARMMELYDCARDFMAKHGNPNQWGPTHWPPEALIHSDIENGNSYVCVNDAGEIVGTFFFIQGKDVEPTYREITEGAWLDESPYGVVHRLASNGSEKGVGQFCLNWAYERCGHLRVDTHSDNTVMQSLLKKLGFIHCGTIYVEEDHDPRLAYEKSERIKKRRFADMDRMELIKSRHSVRQYLDKAIPEDIRAELNAFANQCNRDGNLNIQIIYDEPECFNTRMAHYGKFVNVNNYIAMMGKKTPDLEEHCGYYGEKLVLRAQELGLNTCWVALTHGKSKAVVGADEKEVIIIALGYGATQGSARKSKSASDVSNVTADSPEWFKKGVEAALLAPTAVNQQKFRFDLDGNKVKATAGKFGTNLKVDLGIVKCHFEIGAGAENFEWA